MTRKTLCIFLAALLAVGSIAVVFAAEKENGADYAAAVEVLRDGGLEPSAAAALAGSGTVPALQSRESGLSLTELEVQAWLTQQQTRRQTEEEAHRRLRRGAYLAAYDGAMLEEAAVLRARPEEASDALRTLAAGKVARLLDITEDGWYQVSFAGVTGYLPAACCRGVRYADYEGTAAAMDVTEALVAYARTWLGSPYVYGGSSKSGTDCSGFTMQVFAQVGYSLSHGARTQYAASQHVSVVERQRGDLVFFSGPGESGITHVGIYLGDGAFIHASYSQGVVIDNINGPYYSTYYYGAGRILSE